MNFSIWDFRRDPIIRTVRPYIDSRESANDEANERQLRLARHALNKVAAEQKMKAFRESLKERDSGRASNVVHMSMFHKLQAS